MPRDLMPALTFVRAGEDRAAIGPEVQPHRLAFVTRHGLPKNGEVALLRQSARGLQVSPPSLDRHTAAAASGGKRPAKAHSKA